jgi:hypothetical protein
MLHFLRNLKFFWVQFQNSLWHTITSLQQKWCNNNLLGVVPVLQGLQRSLQSCPNKDVKVQAPLRIIEFSVLGGDTKAPVFGGEILQSLVVIQKLQSLVENSTSFIHILRSLLLCYFSGSKSTRNWHWHWKLFLLHSCHTPWSCCWVFFSGTKKSTRTDWQNHTVATSDLTQKRTVENWGVTMWIQLP